MFSYLRYFFLISIVLIIIAAFVLGWYYRSAANDIVIHQSEENNLTIGQSFGNSLWQENKALIKAFYNVPPENRTQYQEFVVLETFSKKLVSNIQGLPVVRFAIYAPDGKKFFATNQRIISLTSSADEIPVHGDMEKNLSVEAVAGSGKIESEIVTEATFRAPAGNNMNGTLVRTLIPLKADSSTDVISNQPAKVDGVVEIYTDVTDSFTTLRSFQWIGTVFIIVVFTILLGVLLFTTRRAEKIIEKQYETNIELASAKSRAENENQAKSQFLASISHELRTPLNAIIGFSEIIKDEVMGPLENEQYQNYIRDIHSSGVHLLSLINDILDFSKAEAGKLEMEYEDADLLKLVSVSLRLQEPRANSADVKLIKQLPEEAIVVKTDSKRLKQVLLNLLSNAVKFTPAGGSVTVSVWKDFKAENVSIEVKDTGIGIAPKDIARALAPFGQVDSELSRKYEGTGLGLPLTKKFIELLGGEMRLDSEVNKGTTITVILPIDSSNKAKHINAESITV